MKDVQTNRPLKILLADDGSQHSLAAVAMLCDLPLPSRSTITALAVLTPRDASNHTAMEAALRQTQAILSDKDVEIKTELLLGHPAQILIEYADQSNPDLIVMGAKGLRATLGILLGGIAQQVVEYANWPVLVVRAPYAGMKQVLLVTDGSECSQLALGYMAGTSQRPHFPLPTGAVLTVMHVLPPISRLDLNTPPWPIGTEVLPAFTPQQESEMLAWQEEEERNGQALLAQSLSALQAAGITAHSELRRGDAATEILEFARSNNVDLICAGSRGLSQVQSWLLGSVSRKLVHYAGCSVLVVKGGRDGAP